MATSAQADKVHNSPRTIPPSRLINRRNLVKLALTNAILKALPLPRAVTLRSRQLPNGS